MRSSEPVAAGCADPVGFPGPVSGQRESDVLPPELNIEKHYAMRSIRFLLAALLPLMSVSCGPLSYTMDVEMRDVSRSGLDLGKKTFSVVYIDSGARTDSVFSASVSEGLAEKLESGYFSGERVIGIYRIPGLEGVEYSSKDTLLNILMDVGTDVVFLLEVPEFGTPVVQAPKRVETGGGISADSAFVAEVKIPFSIRIDVYDAMNPEDSVFSFTGRSVAVPVAYTDGNDSQEALVAKGFAAIGESGRAVGRSAGESFVSTWVNENLQLLYYEGSAWIEAAEAASDYRWKDAIDIWIRLLDTGNLQKRSCAQYNIALACYMTGEYELASEWLDRSDETGPISLSRGLRQRIEARKR